MPILNVKLSGAPSTKLSQAIAAALIELTTEILHKNPAITAVAIDYIAPQHWFVGGAALALRCSASFFLDITIVDGTNTKDEKARYIAAVFARMGELVGELHPESYILVHDVRADAYGFGGVTQEARYVMAKRP